ncbi:MAG TPA: redoxin domain-containing protein [Gemmatimonadales bacterium]|nr:redoxin domain-containing protein [Gemmatimonadales bacterium]
MAFTATFPPVGSLAPDFTLTNDQRAPVTLSSFRGTHNVVLAFFPWAFTSTCTAELCDFGTDYSQFASADTVVLGISCDSVPALREFKAKERITVDLLSDAKRTVSRAYGVLIEELFVSGRAYVLVDKAGVIRWTWMEAELGHRRSNAELLAELAALR